MAGNHDLLFEKAPSLGKLLVPNGVIYLEDREVEVMGVRIYGSPWQPEFQNWAFNLPRGHRLREKWNRIPRSIDVLVTHGPPLGVRDYLPDGEHVGCGDMKKVVYERVKPPLHLFGHVHHANGWTRVGNTLAVNCALMDEAYRPTQKAYVIDYDPETKFAMMADYEDTGRTALQST